MNIAAAFSLFALIIVIYMVIAELFTILFRFTGLPDEKARFQVISLLTGCGFTTRESEMFLSSRSRRRMARVTMLFGYVFNITVVSSFINVFISMKQAQAGQYILGILVPIAEAAVLVMLIRVPKIRAWLERRLEMLVNRYFRTDHSNYAMIVDYIGAETIAVVTLLSVPEALRDKTLAEINLRREENILVLLVEKPGEKPVPAGAETVFADGDKLTVFGDYARIRQVFDAQEQFDDQTAPVINV